MSSAVTESQFALSIQMICHDLERNLKPNRLAHIYGVIQSSLRLAAENGVDLEKAALAAALHDCAKYVSREETLKLVEAGAITLDPVDMDYPAIWHGKVGAWIAREKYGITDPEILDAVEHHTLGHTNPSKLLQVLMCADTCEPGRSFPGVEELRGNVRNDLHTGLLAVLKAKVCEITERGKIPHPRIFETMKSLEN